MSWLILIVAGLFEAAWALGLKSTEGFTRLWPSVWTLAAMAVSVWLLAVAMKTLPVGTAYAVWVGIGTLIAVLLGMVIYREPVTVARLASLVLILAGVVGLKLTTPL